MNALQYGYMYAQLDVHYVGGFSRALQVAKMSLVANWTIVPHSPT